MNTLDEVAPAFVEMAHRIVWATVATVDRENRPRGRVLHPYWQWNDNRLVGWILTGPTPLKLAHLDHSPFLSVNYLDPNFDTATAECRAEWVFEDDERIRLWDLFKHAPEPVGYDPAIVPPWREGPTSPAFAALKLDPWRIRVMPGTVMLEGKGETLAWSK